MARTEEEEEVGQLGETEEEKIVLWCGGVRAGVYSTVITVGDGRSEVTACHSVSEPSVCSRDSRASACAIDCAIDRAMNHDARPRDGERQRVFTNARNSL